MKLLFIYTLLAVSLFSCGKKENTIDTSRDNISFSKAELDSNKEINKSETSILSEKYNAISNWDTGRTYAYQVQEKFEKGDRPISFIGYIGDITKVDSNYILKLYNEKYNGYNNYIAEVSISYIYFQKIKDVFARTKKIKKWCFIFKLKKITSSYPKLSSSVSEDKENSYLTYEFDETIIHFTGELLDFYKFKNEK